MERKDIRECDFVMVDEGVSGDNSYVPYKVLVRRVGEMGSIEGRVVSSGGGSSFYLGNYNKGDVIHFAPFQASPIPRKEFANALQV